ncbi:uncharacterized protein N7446_010508 [Penicillium canescens]|uniref:MORN repeat-containing protein n=1 Tax=Penicillium canescens TaxID=5083 RepID=A0AAD6N8L2_PENCN|nr:uncharacterized protein N7446_010508 [Penicillium canescens]KAJ6041611.1 hypothetical protein N7460_007001 [Penicillium canescens]KAJ6050399.1 hypothetical protein N7446_010508 [Penicillium canescens]KAJ6064700.1 hypothetical protein N7444_000353 [Penicillium canescens]
MILSSFRILALTDGKVYLMQRVLADRIGYPGDGLYYFDGEPFSGVSYTTKGGAWENSEAEIHDGLLWGTTKEWYGPGQLMHEASYFKGVLHGNAREWHKSGQLAEDGDYEYGIALWKKSWDENGQLIEEFTLTQADEDFTVLQRYRSIYEPGHSKDAGRKIGRKT